jgi:hypothetical protein
MSAFVGGCFQMVPGAGDRLDAFTWQLTKAAGVEDIWLAFSHAIPQPRALIQSLLGVEGRLKKDLPELPFSALPSPLADSAEGFFAAPPRPASLEEARRARFQAGRRFLEGFGRVLETAFATGEIIRVDVVITALQRTPGDGDFASTADRLAELVMDRWMAIGDRLPSLSVQVRPPPPALVPGV